MPTQVFGCCMPSTRAASNLLMGALTYLLPLYVWLEVCVHRIRHLFSCSFSNSGSLQVAQDQLATIWAMSALLLRASQWLESSTRMPVKQYMR